MRLRALFTGLLVLAFSPVPSTHAQAEANKSSSQQRTTAQQSSAQQPAQSTGDGVAGSGNDVQIAAGDIRLSSGTLLHVEQLNVTSTSRLSQQGCKEQTILIHSGRLSLTDAGLTQLINHSLEKKGDKKRIKVTAEDGKLNFEGSKAAGMNMAFKAKPTALGDSRIALVATDVKMEHLPVRGLLHTFGLNLHDLMHPKNPAIKVGKDNLIVDLRYVSQRPRLEGRVTSVLVEGNRIVLTFSDSGAKRAATQAKNAAPQQHKSK